MTSSASTDPAFAAAPSPAKVPQHAPHLTDRAEYLDFDENCCIADADAPPTGRLFKLFVGHVTFEVTAPQLRWILYMLTGVTCGKVEKRGNGCYMVFLMNHEEMWTVKGLHKRALFDHGRVWFAQNPDQEATLQQYASTQLKGLHAHLPNGLVVIDEETSRRRSGRGGSKPSNPAAVPIGAAYDPQAVARQFGLPSPLVAVPPGLPMFPPVPVPPMVATSGRIPMQLVPPGFVATPFSNQLVPLSWYPAFASTAASTNASVMTKG